MVVQQRIFRWATAGAGLLFVALTAGFVAGWGPVTAVWPFISAETRLGHVFLASITIAIALPALWIAATGSLRSAAAGAADLFVMFALMATYLFALASAPDGRALGGYAVGAAALTVVLLAAFVFAQRQPWTDPRRMPVPLRVAFAVVCVVLVVVGTQLVRQSPHVFPWPLTPESSVMYGFIFYGAAVYFLIGALEGRWAAAAGQLIGFLAYDLVLIVPFVRRLATVPPEHRASLVIYTSVLLASGAVAVHYLFVNRRTRMVGTAT